MPTGDALHGVIDLSTVLAHYVAVQKWCIAWKLHDIFCTPIGHCAGIIPCSSILRNGNLVGVNLVVNLGGGNLVGNITTENADLLFFVCKA